MLPSVLAKQLEKGLTGYLETTFPMTNEPFRGSLQRMLETVGFLHHEPYFSVRLPFRSAGAMPTCFKAVRPRFIPHVHQAAAYDRLTGEGGRSALIATGTGSGKTECFAYPILEYCWTHRGERGIKALILYPMNALASDQAKRFSDWIWNNPDLRGNVTVGMYVGGYEDHPSRMMGERNIITDHETLLAAPPDILMTNYKMLDYLLVRPRDAGLWAENKPETLKYIVVDELHTFDGAQGTDLACLLRRLKSRLWTPGDYLCCVGTSATMGTGDDAKHLLSYAEAVFGEPFEEDAVITEDRLTPEEFFVGHEATDFTVPDAERAEKLNELIEKDDQEAYLRAAAAAWLEGPEADLLTAEGRIALGERLTRHSFVQSMIRLMRGRYYQVSALVEELRTSCPELPEMGNAEAAINALLALISHARSGRPESPQPFLNVHVQLWIRELRRLLSRVSASDAAYSLSRDLNEEQMREYLPIVNCRDCGATGWASLLSEHRIAVLKNLETFYNLYFRADGKIVMMFPHTHKNYPMGMIPGRVCPSCLHVDLGEGGSHRCAECGVEKVDIVLPNPVPTAGHGENRHFVCPFCGSDHGLSLMGLRSATEISAELSQLLTSKFNDDKKTLAFSDNVQDAAHRAGFFNARTWRFGLRTAIQRYVQNGGAGLSLARFKEGFLRYWHGELDDEDFVSLLIAPNLTWMRAYEDMVEKRRLGRDAWSRTLMDYVEKRAGYEILLEYGLGSRTGRTLEKSGCSCLSFPEGTIRKVADAVQERIENELGGPRGTGPERARQMVAGYLGLMARGGGFQDEAFSRLFRERGNPYWITNARVPWMPGRWVNNVPRFLCSGAARGRGESCFETAESRRYTKWIASFRDNDKIVDPSTYEAISRIILKELVRDGIVASVNVDDQYDVYALDEERVFITDRVAQMRCDACGIAHAVAEEDAGFWEGAPCLRATCGGRFRRDASAALDYYGKLFSSGDIVRVNAREHTGLLERKDREALEADFKRGREETRGWDPNVLSCTPTLEMGIDIGELSSIILCSVPPAQAQFLQRTGRAGRRDGNALTLVVAASRPHDLYFYADPTEMIDGGVTPPRVFLKASAVLERQFVAYCMDSWVKRGVAAGAVPKNVSAVLGKLEHRPADAFPFNFLNYVQNNLSYLMKSFLKLFDQHLDETEEEELRGFARGDGLRESPMHLRVLEAFETLKKQKEALSQSIQQLKDREKELEAHTRDSSYDEEIRDLKAERGALLNVVKEINKKDIFNFLSDEGLLPNYAFPEAGIILKAVLYRREEAAPEGTETQPKKRQGKSVYEYARAASAAISEFAPLNRFYVGGRKLTIDQVDLNSAQPALWRLCPSCSHAQLEEAGKDTAFCPRCGSPKWADVGQVRNMLKVQMVYSNMDYGRSMIADESEDRSQTFYDRQILVDVDEDHDILLAYKMDNDEFSFGYEFVRKATFREINFGAKDDDGDKLTVAGVDGVRRGFKVCRYCGKIQSDPDKPIHTGYCRARRALNFDEDPFEECLFLYREFVTEALRILIPATASEAFVGRTDSFVAAFMLGMKEYFGNVDHLRATISEVPVPDADYRKQYLVIYDSIPGGTGYLKQLMKEQGSLIEILERALHTLEQCSCKEDPQKDGCYRCLYAYRQSIGNISRRAAIRVLKSILKGKGRLKKIDKLGNVPVNPIVESELEQRFVSALDRMRTENRPVELSQSLVREKEGYVLRLSRSTWEIEPQVPLGPEQGVSVPCRPDFIIRPIGHQDKLPVAIFTDGFAYHRDRVADDTLKREAIRRSGRYRVWVLTWRDVQSAFQAQGDYATPTLASGNMPSGPKIYQPTLKDEGAEAMKPEKMSPLELLLDYLDREDAEKIFQAQARAYSLSLLEPWKAPDERAFAEWRNACEGINGFVGEPFTQPGLCFGRWVPRPMEAHFRAYAGIPMETGKADKKAPVAVLSLLDDRLDSRTNKYEQEWNGFWHFFNVMQFNGIFAAACETGLDAHVYVSLPHAADRAEETIPARAGGEDWAEIREMLFDEESLSIAEGLEAAGIAAPDAAGYELSGDAGGVFAELELAWLERKIGYMTALQRTDRERAEGAGWRIFASVEEAVTFFEGE